MKARSRNDDGTDEEKQQALTSLTSWHRVFITAYMKQEAALT